MAKEYMESEIKQIFIGKYIEVTFYYEKVPRKVLITDIQFTVGYPENFPTYYTIYSTNSKGEKYFVMNLPETDFHKNSMFSDTPDIKT